MHRRPVVQEERFTRRLHLAEFLRPGGKLIRCAIYTRPVRSDDGLSSCQVQFELCASYVRALRQWAGFCFQTGSMTMGIPAQPSTALHFRNS